MANEKKPDDPILQIARSLEILLKLKVEEIKGSRNQTELIHTLGDYGLNGSEIASLLNAPRTTVAPELSKYLKSKSDDKPSKSSRNRKG